MPVPTGVKVFNWVYHVEGFFNIRNSDVVCLRVFILFTLGGFTGLVLSLTPVDVQLHDTYYVVAHFHYVMVAGALYAAFAGVYFWLPKWIGKMYDEKLGKFIFGYRSYFFNCLFPSTLLGLAGMPRRIPDYSVQFADFNLVSSIGAFGFGLSQLLFLYILLKAIRSGEKAEDKQWDGADSLEWTHLPSPAPYHSLKNHHRLSKNSD